MMPYLFALLIAFSPLPMLIACLRDEDSRRRMHCMLPMATVAIGAEMLNVGLLVLAIAFALVFAAGGLTALALIQWRNRRVQQRREYRYALKRHDDPTWDIDRSVKYQQPTWGGDEQP